jgi:3D (Asp-Asp-Asp) domain-containing protein
MKYFVTLALIMGVATFSSTETYIADTLDVPPKTPEFTGIAEGIVTAYSSEVQQTDSTPRTTASGKEVRQGIIANNCLDFGTRVEIDGVRFEVQDRMASRYGCEYYDIWFPSREEAVQWGRQIKSIKISNMDKESFEAAVGNLVEIYRDGDTNPLTETDIIKLLDLVQRQIRKDNEIIEEEPE